MLSSVSGKVVMGKVEADGNLQSGSLLTLPRDHLPRNQD